MPKRTPPLQALHAFVVTSRYLNLTHAAKELFVTQGAVSRQIATLEAYLGFRLFHRHARGLTLTRQGRMLLPEVQSAFDQLFHATEKLCHENAEIHLKAPTCSIRWLLPQLIRLRKEQPALNVALTTTTDHSVDFNTEHYDAAIVFSQTPLTHLPDTHLLFSERLSPVIAPHLYTGDILTRGECSLQDLTLLHPTPDKTDWALWSQTASVPLESLTRHQYFDTMELAISAAIQGFGIAIADCTLVEEDIRMKRLLRPFFSDG